MEIRYPLKAFTDTGFNIGGPDSRSDDTRDLYLYAFDHAIGTAEKEFLIQLVADANEAATVKADYERLGKKIDDMVEARVEAAAKVDERVINGLRAAGSVVQDDNRKLRAENRRLREEVGELLAARDLLSVKLDRVEKEYADTRLSPATRRFVDHKDGDPTNNAPGNLNLYYRDRVVAPDSAREVYDAEYHRRRGLQDQERSNVFYRDLAELLAKTFGVRFPFPKQHSEESEL